VGNALPGHSVHTAARLGWAELENGDLLSAAEEAGFDLFIICDKNMRYQQNLAVRKIAVLELWTNHRPTLEKYWAYIQANADSMKPGEYHSLQPPNA